MDEAKLKKIEAYWVEEDADIHGDITTLIEEIRRLQAEEKELPDRLVPFEVDLRIGGWAPRKETAAAERERCAEIAENYESPTGDEMAEDGCHYIPPQEAIAVAIRALPEEP